MKSTLLDPWKMVCDESSVNVVTDARQDETVLRFEDSFVADHQTSAATCSRLPDSAEYLASLESKLAKLKSKRQGKDILKSLEEKHKSCIMNLLSNDSHSMLGDEDFILDTPVSNSHPLLRYVAPDKQALTFGELVELLKADHLAELIEQQDQEEDRTSQHSVDGRPS